MSESKLVLPCDVGEVSDGFHTFNELYEHRVTLFIVLMLSYQLHSWIAKKHSDGSELDGWFIAGMNLPIGAITYHLPMDKWDYIVENSSNVEVLDIAPEWDGHTASDVIERLKNWKVKPNEFPEKS